ncbi:MAG: hypothetical protein Q9193_006062, partial [Seirophora villosa]
MELVCNTVDHAERTRENLLSRIATIIDEELARSNDPPTTLLRIEAIACLDHNERSCHPSYQRRILGTIDMRSWHNPPSHIVQDTASASLPSPPPTDSSESAACISHHQRESQTPELDDPLATGSTKRRKIVGGLRLAKAATLQRETPKEASPEAARRLQADAKSIPQRKRHRHVETPALRPSSWDKLVQGVWERIYGPFEFSHERLDTLNAAGDTFRDVSSLCLRVIKASRFCRSLEVIVQAHWIECFDARVEAFLQRQPATSRTQARKLILAEACRDFGWAEKYLRNQMAVWRGYREIKDVGGWVTLAFAGAGLYRYCKYRIGFDQRSMSQFRRLRKRFEVAAGTLHPEWPKLLSVIGVSVDHQYHGHPHDWVVQDEGDPIPLAATYEHQPGPFIYRQITEPVIDEDAWQDMDPRQISHRGPYICAVCGRVQSDEPATNQCSCFSDLYGDKTRPRAVQVFRTKDGRNNGVVACCPFERGTAVGEFIGRITSGLSGIDVMEGRVGENTYQIWQGREGNFTRFINHSCAPNCQFQKFVWLGVERVILVSRGIDAEREITVDYGDRYWEKLEKRCLCG